MFFALEPGVGSALNSLVRVSLWFYSPVERTATKKILRRRSASHPAVLDSFNFLYLFMAPIHLKHVEMILAYSCLFPSECRARSRMRRVRKRDSLVPVTLRPDTQSQNSDAPLSLAPPSIPFYFDLSHSIPIIPIR